MSDDPKAPPIVLEVREELYAENPCGVTKDAIIAKLEGRLKEVRDAIKYVRRHPGPDGIAKATNDGRGHL